MSMELTHSMAEIIEKIVKLTPTEITNMSIEEINKHTAITRKKNRLFHKFLNFRIPRKKKYKFSSILPRGSMIVANYRFIFREDTNKKIKKIR